MSKLILRPSCWVLGHKFLAAKDKPGWRSIFCDRCGFDWTRTGHYRYVARFRIGKALVALANAIDKKGTPTLGWQLINNIEYIDRKHLQSLVNQGSDQLISQYLSEEGWIKIGEDNADEMVALINKSLTLEATRQEQEELNSEK